MKQYNILNNTLGWVTFFIAAFVYCSTVEPTASFWDCPEFITTGYKLEVGHPPGAPFFMLTANLFSQFASSSAQVAYMVNIMNALLSAMCILFLFWTITHLTRKLLIDKWEDLTLSKTISIQASGLVGALIYTFSDTFWYSAVEGEVYAYSSAFTAVVFWLILKWEDHADEPQSDRWLVLIAYLTGLSIGVHLLNLLCIPAIVLVYYYKRFPNANSKGSLIALAISFFIVAAVLYGLVPGIITVGGWFELLFVNVMNFKFNSGLYVYIVLLVASIIWGVYETYQDKSLVRQNIAFITVITMLGIPFYGFGFSSVFIGIIVIAILFFVLRLRKNKLPLVSARIKNTILLSLMMIVIGYSSYAVIVIRSSANPPMDQNSPEDIFTLGSYLSRDQYGDRPLLYGRAYASEYKVGNDGRIDMSEGAPVYQRKEKRSADENDQYIIVQTKDKPNYAQNVLFPRMYSSDHTAAYEQWFGGSQQENGWVGGVVGTQMPSNYQEGMSVKVPTLMENLQFFISYQCNFMYWRYFLWNFAGRQNDIQSGGEIEHGNWLSGIPFIDNARLGNQNTLPDDLKNNKGHNVFYCLPLLLGLIGLLWQAFRGEKGIRQFWVVFFLFFMTGLAIVIYLNQTPQQPRERDYAYAGSFYAFAIWCGLGVAGLIDIVKRFMTGELLNKKQQPKKQLSTSVKTSLAVVISLLCLLVPIQMVSQTWDDHDRSGRYVCRDTGNNYLMSLQEKGNPIIFTNGDNDTFPLWYCQDVEELRQDARVCNLSYLQTDWYIDQMVRPAYTSTSMPITWDRYEYVTGKNEVVEVRPEMKQTLLEAYKINPEGAKKLYGEEPFELKNILKYWVRNEDEQYHFIPTDTVYVTIDKEAVKKSGMLMASDTIPDKMIISLSGHSRITKSELMMLEIIANANWTRPVYVATTVGEENFMNLGDNFVQEGLVNRITPFLTNKSGVKRFDTDKTYDIVMNKFKSGGLEKKGLYLDETVLRACYTQKRLYTTLAQNLIAENKKDKAKKVLEKMERVLPEYNVPIDIRSTVPGLIYAYNGIGNKAKALYVANALWKYSKQYITWYVALDQRKFMQSISDCLMHFQLMSQVLNVTQAVDNKWYNTHSAEFERLLNQYQSKGGIIPGM